MDFPVTEYGARQCDSMQTKEIQAALDDGFRNWLTDDEKIHSAKTGEHCRHKMHTPFQCYCEFRADIRYTPGNIVVRNCRFDNPNALFPHPYGTIWCCNRPLSEITYEDCEILGLELPGVLRSDSEEPSEFPAEECEADRKRRKCRVPHPGGKQLQIH